MKLQIYMLWKTGECIQECQKLYTFPVIACHILAIFFQNYSPPPPTSQAGYFTDLLVSCLFCEKINWNYQKLIANHEQNVVGTNSLKCHQIWFSYYHQAHFEFSIDLCFYLSWIMQKWLFRKIHVIKALFYFSGGFIYCIYFRQLNNGQF